MGESREIVLSGRGQAGYRKWLWGRNQKVLHGYVSSRHHQATPNGNSLAKKRMHNEKSIHLPASVGAQDDDIKRCSSMTSGRTRTERCFLKGLWPGKAGKRDNKINKWLERPIGQSSKVQAFGSMRRFWKSLPRSKKTTFRGPGFVFWNQAPEISRTVFWVYETALNKNFSACEEIFSYLVASSVLAKICAEKWALNVSLRTFPTCNQQPSKYWAL